MSCDRHPFGDATGLVCTQPAGHLHGCMFEASDAPDRHTAEASDD